MSRFILLNYMAFNGRRSARVHQLTEPEKTAIKFAPQLINDLPFFSTNRIAFPADGKEFYYLFDNTCLCSHTKISFL